MAQIAAAVPSPPSAIGTISMFASGKTSRSPFATFSATSRALSAPLNLSGAMRIFIVARASRLRVLSASRRHALPQFSLQNFARDLRIRCSFREFHHWPVLVILRKAKDLRFAAGADHRRKTFCDPVRGPSHPLGMTALSELDV